MKQPQWKIVSAWFCGLLMFWAGCRLNPVEGLRWDTDLLAPIAYTRVSVFDAIQDTSLFEVNSEELLHLVFRDTVASTSLVDFVEVPDTTLDIGIKLDTLDLSTDTISEIITLQDLADQLKADGNPAGDILINNDGNKLSSLFVLFLPDLSFGPVDVDASEFFEFAELESGQLVLTITNEFPVGLDSVVLQVNNKNIPGPPIVADTFYSILPQTSVSRSYDLAGKQVESQLEAELAKIKVFAVSDSILIDLEDYIEISLVGENLRAKTATAIFPQQTILDTTRFTKYEFGRDFEDVQLTKLGVKSGKIKAETTSTVEDTILFSYQLLSARNAANDIPGVAIKLNPAPPGGISYQLEEAELDGFTVDLTANGSSVNSIEEQIKVDLLYSGNLITLDQTDSIAVSFGLVDIVPTYVEGYIGQNEFVIKGSEAVDFFSQIDVEKIRFAGATAEIVIGNSVGVDAQMEVRAFNAKNSQSGESLKLTGSPLVAGPFFIAGPDLPDTNRTAETVLSFHPDNSNIVPFINLLADEIEYDITVLTNHNGDPALRDNFVTTSSGISAILDFSLPLEGVIGGLVLRDTTGLNFSQDLDLETLNAGTLRLVLENRFPVEVALDAIVYDASWDEVARLAEGELIEAGIPNASGFVDIAVESSLEKSLTLDELEEVIQTGKHLVFSFRVDTKPEDENVKIYAEYDIVARLVGEFSFQVEN